MNNINFTHKEMIGFIRKLLELYPEAAEPVKHGHWEHKVKRWANDTDIYVSNTCNLCKEESYGMYHYCPNCGAKMDEVK